MENKWIAHVGPHEVDIWNVVRDPRGIEDVVKDVMEHDFIESRYTQFGAHLNVFPDAADIADWDHALLERYPALYTQQQDACADCAQGPCNLKKAAGKCGLQVESFRGRLSLRKACRGCASQMTTSRGLLNYALKLWPEDKPVSMGELLGMSDHCPPIGTLSGMYVKNLKDLNRVLSYGEAQLAELLQASYSATVTATEFESMVMHAGSVLLLAMGVAEMLKVSCFGFMSAANQKIDELDKFPPATLAGGWASVEKGKPVIAFAGDDFLPAWCAIQFLQENKLTEAVEVCGIGPAGDDTVRFYNRCRIVAPMVRAGKAIRNGVFDVVVAGNACIPLDLLSEAERVGSKFIWTSPQGIGHLADSTDVPVEKIVESLVNGAKAAWIRDAEKAAKVAVAVARQAKRTTTNCPITDESAIGQAKKCPANCDLCFSACPNNLPLPKAVKQLSEGKWDGFFEVEKGCYFCGKCEEVCPVKVGLRDIIVAAERKQAAKDKFIMRAGRGPLPLTEVLQSAFSMVWGNALGIVVVVGCGDAHRESTSSSSISHPLSRGHWSTVGRAPRYPWPTTCTCIRVPPAVSPCMAAYRRLERDHSTAPSRFWFGEDSPTACMPQQPRTPDSGYEPSWGRHQAGTGAASCRATGMTGASGGSITATTDTRERPSPYRSTFLFLWRPRRKRSPCWPPCSRAHRR
ncbi:MAG: hypothetical protein NTU41_08770 [Chloroflexi bacterium]|nr:hypothetical protein [Chloroflexota bacterium]